MHPMNVCSTTMGGDHNGPDYCPCALDYPALAGEYQRTRGLDVDWFVAEVVAYYKIYDHHDVWRESGARALGEWLRTRLGQR